MLKDGRLKGIMGDGGGGEPRLLAQQLLLHMFPWLPLQKIQEGDRRGERRLLLVTQVTGAPDGLMAAELLLIRPSLMKPLMT